MDKSRAMNAARFAVAAAVLCAAGTAGADDGKDFIAEAKVIYRVVACGGTTEAAPSNLDAKTVDAHCTQMAKMYDSIKGHYFEPASAFFAPLRPKDLPTTVVYPFGGGDLLGALVTYPDARDITTISLEHAGD